MCDLIGGPSHLLVQWFTQEHYPIANVVVPYAGVDYVIRKGTPANMFREAERQATRRFGRFAALRIYDAFSRDTDSPFAVTAYIYLPRSFGRWTAGHHGTSLWTHDVHLQNLTFFLDHPQWLADRLNEMQLREPLLAALGHPLWRKFFVEIDGDHAMLSRVLSF